MTLNPNIISLEQPEEADHQAILDGLIAFNAAKAGPSGYEVVAILIRDGDTTLGGLWGKILYDWMFVELLFVPETLRGQDFGTRLMQSAETRARDKGLAGIWLDTFAFQAPLFYQGLGYEIFGELPDHPRGQTRYLLRKLL